MNTEGISISNTMGDASIRERYKNVLKSPNINSIGKGRKALHEYEQNILQSIFGIELNKADYRPL